MKKSKDLALLERHEHAVKRRIARRSAAVGDRLDRAISPWMREYPKTGLAAGAVAGLVLGSALAPSAGAKGRAAGGRLGFLGSTAAHALRVSLVKSLTSHDSEKTEPSSSED